MVEFLRSVAQEFTLPKAIVVISAHWEEALPTVSSAAMPGMIFDYSGFPRASYELDYPAPGHPTLAKRIVERLTGSGIAAATDPRRGFDHGTFVPLMLMYPQANVPVVQLSLIASLDPGAHIRLGQAVAELSREGVLILGSGMSFHNMTGFGPSNGSASDASVQFDRWLNSVLVDGGVPERDRIRQMLAWDEAIHARNCHPREEHLLPLHVCFGAAQQLGLSARNVFSDNLLGAKVSAFLWG